jgi:hypothetical protein
MESAEAKRCAKAWVASLTDEELQRMARGIRLPDEISFIESLQIEDKVSGGLIPFKLWAFQKELIEFIDANDRAFVLKARQLGITWVVLAHALYLATFWGNREFLICSQTGDDAIAALHRLRVMHASMPACWRRAKLKDNTEQIAFDNGSRIEAMMATRRAGRGKAPYLTIADEVEFWDDAALKLETLQPGAQRMVGITTGNGPDGPAPKIWRSSQEGKGRWRAVFFPWSVHPARDEAWYQVNVLEAAEPRLARREFAATPEEAFAAPQGVFFERWDAEINAPHVLSAVHNWETWRCVDFGFHWPACLWVQFSPAGRPVVVAELARREPYNWTTEEFADHILAIDASLNLVMPPRGTYCDPAGANVTATTGESEFDIFKVKGLAPSAVKSSIRDGCVRLMDSIGDPDLPLVVSQSCTWTVEALGAISPDRKRPDVYDETSSYTHVLDALRYFMVNQAVSRQVWPDINYHELTSPFPQF